MLDVSTDVDAPGIRDACDVDALGIHDAYDADARDEHDMVDGDRNVSAVDIACISLVYLALVVGKSQASLFEIHSYKFVSSFKSLHFIICQSLLTSSPFLLLPNHTIKKSDKTSE